MSSTEPDTSTANGSGKVKIPDFLDAIKVTTDLRFMALIVARTSRFFDEGDVRMFCEVCRPLRSYSIRLDVWHNTLKEFQLRDLPMVDWVFLPSTSTGI
jgi:hypothetical protein